MSSITAFSPSSLSEALGILSNAADGSITVVAGGTDIMVIQGMSLDGIFKDSILNVLNIKELSFIEERGDVIELGPNVTHAEIASSAVVKKFAPILSETASIIGGPQIRNRGTIGGNICNASPAGDLLPPLFALNARLTLSSSSGEKIVPIFSFALAPRKTVLLKNELLTKITIDKVKACEKCGFKRVAPRKALAITKASVAVVACMDNGVVSNVRIALGSVGPVILRAAKTEKLLDGSKLDKDLIGKAATLVNDDFKPISDIRSTASYRSHVVGILLKRILEGFCK